MANAAKRKRGKEFCRQAAGSKRMSCAIQIKTWTTTIPCRKRVGPENQCDGAEVSLAGRFPLLAPLRCADLPFEQFPDWQFPQPDCSSSNAVSFSRIMKIMKRPKKIAPTGSPRYQKMDSPVLMNPMANETSEIVRKTFLSFMPGTIVCDPRQRFTNFAENSTNLALKLWKIIASNKRVNPASSPPGFQGWPAGFLQRCERTLVTRLFR